LANDGDLFLALMEWTGRQKMFEHGSGCANSPDH